MNIEEQANGALVNLEVFFKQIMFNNKFDSVYMSYSKLEDEIKLKLGSLRQKIPKLQKLKRDADENLAIDKFQERLHLEEMSLSNLLVNLEELWIRDIIQILRKNLYNLKEKAEKGEITFNSAPFFNHDIPRIVFQGNNIETVVISKEKAGDNNKSAFFSKVQRVIEYLNVFNKAIEAGISFYSKYGSFINIGILGILGMFSG